MRFGADYYPEHWPKSRWAEDARLMRDAKFNVVRMAEFAWSKLEPEEGTYDFDWLDAAVKLLGEHGIDAVLSTPTAIPPDWLTSQHPEILPVDELGRVRRPGTRRHYRYTSDVYRGHCARIVRVMAAHYASNPNVIGWQIDNEWGCHNTTFDYSEDSRRQFHTWLRAKYGTLDELNRRWGTVFWSETFHSWESIPLPWYAPADHNPALMLDYRRWSSQMVADFQGFQVALLRRANPNWFITHNFMGLFDEIDCARISAGLDFASWDNYPITVWGGGVPSPSHAALCHDVTRGFKRRGFWVMEELAGPTGAGEMSPAPRPGQIAFFAWQAIAHGADGMVFFRWRTCPFGAEQYWHGLLEHDGSARRRYREVAAMGARIGEIGSLIEGAAVPAAVAILRDFESCWAYRIQSQTPGFSYDDEIGRYHAALRASRIPVDVIASDSDLSGYKVVFAPCLHIVSDETAANLRAYVEGGGILLGGYRFGVKDADNRVIDAPLPGLLRDVFGVEVEEYDAMGTFHTNRVVAVPEVRGTLGGHSFEVTRWADVLRRTDDAAHPLACYVGDYYAGETAVSVHPYGTGTAVYVGSSSNDPHFYGVLIKWIRDRAEIACVAPELVAPAQVEIAARTNAEGETLIFLLNGSDETSLVTNAGGYCNLLAEGDARKNGPTLQLAPWGVAVLRKNG